MLQLPGLIDPHVHLREPGETHKEDFESGTAAALAGGYTVVLAMPNTQPPLVDPVGLDLARRAAASKSHCDYGIFLGATSENAASLARIADQACGLKTYLDATHGPLHLQGIASIAAHLKHWPAGKPYAVHAEGRSLALILMLATQLERPIHVCHVSRADEIQLIRKTKERGLPITCEVAPHHLLFCENDFAHLSEGERAVRPPLGRPEDRQALWDNFDIIDCIATDHAPHTCQEKQTPDPASGFPGLETSLALLFGAVHDGRLTMEELISRMHTNPQRIFSISPQKETFVEFDPQEVWEVKAADLKSRCGWTPYEGMRLVGRVRRVILRGHLAYDDGEVLAQPGFGNNLYPS